MSEICKNCSTEIQLNFCGNCGQKKAKRIDRNYIKDELQYTVLHMNKGFFFSIKQILKAPGKTAREFLEGNRVNHYKPILLVFVIAGISAFLTNTFIHPVEIMQKYSEAHPMKSAFDLNTTNKIIYNYQSFVMLFTIPFMAFFTWLVFKKWGYNYYENVIINAYSLVFLLLLSIIFVLPIQYFFRGNPELFVIIPTIVSFLLMILMFPWFYINLYDKKSAGDVILRLLLLAITLFATLIIFTVVVGIIYAISLHK